MKRTADKIMMMVVGMALLAAPVMAQVLFSDDFNDGNRDGWYKYNDGDASRSLATSNNYLETVSGGTYGLWGAVANFSAADLTVVGASVNLSLDFQIMEDIGGETILIGLFDSGGTTIFADQADLTSLTNEVGYYMYNRLADLILKNNSALKGAGLGQVNGDDSLQKKQPSPYAVATNIWHSYSLTITNNVGNIEVELVIDSTTLSSSTSPIQTTSFDTVAIQALRKDFAVDNVVVTYTDPPANPNPPVFIEDPIVRANGTNGVAYGGSITNTATDADGDIISYSSLSFSGPGPDWLNIAANGNLSGTPGTANEGLNTWTVQADDGFDTDTATLNITVVYTTNNPPVFSADPIVEADGTTGIGYVGTIADAATDPDSDTLTYTKVSYGGPGSDWLTIATNGVLSGTPGELNAGANSWNVEVSDGLGGTAAATLNINVIALETLYSEDFSNPSFTNDWYLTLTNATRSVVADSGYMAVVTSDSAFGTWNAVKNITPADLSTVGDIVVMSMDFQILQSLGGRTIGIGLFDSKGTMLTANVGDYGATSNDYGFFMYDRDDDVIAKDSIVGMSSVNGTKSLQKAVTATFAVADFVWHTYELTLERTSASVIAVSIVLDKGLASELTVGGNSVNVVDSVDEVVLFSNGYDFAVDNIVVSGTAWSVMTPYDIWAEAQGLTEGVNAGYDDDAELVPDGLVNWLEYAFGGNPLANDAATYRPAPELATDGGSNYLNYVYRRRVDAAARGLTYTVTSGTGLGALTNPTEEAGSAAIDADFESVTNRVPSDVEDVQFMKLHVTLDEG